MTVKWCQPDESAGADRVTSRYQDRGATFDASRFYRYRLWRRWNNGQIVLWIMLNPSTADENVLDPTLRRCEAYSRAWGYAGFDVVNAFALRSTNPKALAKPAMLGPQYASLHPVGERYGAENDRHILRAAAAASLIVCGWGTAKMAVKRGHAIATMLDGRELQCLGTNADGSPRHPLYLAKTTPLVPWPN